jgi:DNA-binding MarR family transcriptional regulator
MEVFAFPDPHQNKIERYLEEYIREHGYGPLNREIAEGTGLSQPTVTRALRRLAQRGVIRRIPGEHRQIALAEKGTAA